MSTQAEILKTEIEAGTFSAYRSGTTPDVAIVGIDELQGYNADQMIKLKNKNQETIFTVAGSRINAGKGYVELIMTDPKSDERDNLLSDLQDIFKASSYSITYDIDEHPDVLQPYSTKLTVRIIV